jgi:eIF-2B alpha/beta/delta-like uncharacterized protein
VDRQIEARIEAIRSDHLSGAVTITQQATKVLVLLAEVTTSRTVADFRSELTEVGRALIAAQPAMASLFNLVNEVLWSAEYVDDVDTMRAVVRAVATNFVAAMVAGIERIAGRAVSLISDGMMVLTHSSSATVLRAFLAAQQAGRRFAVVCTESRPMLEGCNLARQLGAEGIEARLVVDAAAFRMLPKVNLVMVGADAVSPRGVVNKIGTLGLAVTAKEHGVPFYVLCDSEKLVPEGVLAPQAFAQRDPREVAESMVGVTVLNYTFDTTPLEYVTGVVTGEGILGKEELDELWGKMCIHLALLA